MRSSRLKLKGERVREEIESVTARLMKAEMQSDLGDLIAEELHHYTPYDLMQIAAALKQEIRNLPPEYRERLSDHTSEQIFGTYHRILLMKREGKIKALQDPLHNKVLFLTYCHMIQEACLSPDHAGGAHMTPMGRLLYFLLSAFRIFVLHESVHPVGTPFPGGLQVKKKGGVIYCPVRDRADEVVYALCRFCPAEQG
ncbi:DUF2115 domain-containing protein [Methanocalculus chunghsingensis]|uniref:DUF2115 domain-containing protein n=1 Tax=Methanocalculus chunghsingensis TaxID=156457 RepID=UPI001B8CE625|nr:DUF2115 domain-containing protein [Methanocalculus chunghsingensis]